MPAFFVKWIMYLGEWLKEASRMIAPNWGDQAIDLTIEEKKEFIKNFIDSQWRRGENKDGQAVGYYTAYTEKMASGQNTILPKIEGQPYNLLWSGELFNMMTIQRDGSVIYVDSESRNKDSLFYQIQLNDLIANPDSIFGLQDENLKRLYDLINSGLIDKLLKDLKLK